MKLLAVTCMYNRPVISEIFLENMNRLKIDVLPAVSDTPTDKVCAKFLYKGVIDVFLKANNPLGEKWNAVVKVALEYPDWTHLLIIGDDDILSPCILPLIESNAHHPFIGLSQMFMIEPQTKRAIRFHYNTGVVLGSGRVLQRKIVEDLQGELFAPHLERELDTSADIKLWEHSRLRPVVMDKNTEPMMTGIKTSINLWPFTKFEHKEKAAYDKVISWVGDKEKELINKL
jgi:hypothetical protein